MVDHVITRDMTRVAAGQSCYGAILTESGTVCDDAIIANLGNDTYLHCHGSGESMQRLQESAQGLDASIELDDDLHNIAVQGPGSALLLDAHTAMDMASLG